MSPFRSPRHSHRPAVLHRPWGKPPPGGYETADQKGRADQRATGGSQPEGDASAANSGDSLWIPQKQKGHRKDHRQYCPEKLRPCELHNSGRFHRFAGTLRDLFREALQQLCARGCRSDVGRFPARAAAIVLPRDPGPILAVDPPQRLQPLTGMVVSVFCSEFKPPSTSTTGSPASSRAAMAGAPKTTSTTINWEGVSSVTDSGPVLSAVTNPVVKKRTSDMSLSCHGLGTRARGNIAYLSCGAPFAIGTCRAETFTSPPPLRPG